jgi:hypothetical protein
MCFVFRTVKSWLSIDTLRLTARHRLERDRPRSTRVGNSASDAAIVGGADLLERRDVVERDELRPRFGPVHAHVARTHRRCPPDLRRQLGQKNAVIERGSASMFGSPLSKSCVFGAL